MANSEKTQTAVIIGAGPAGLTAALELLRHTNVRPILIEKTDYIGGLSRTVNYKGNRIDIGGHRFFSKSDRVMNWWLDIMPMQATANTGDQLITYRKATTSVKPGEAPPDPSKTDRVMLVRSRKSRIYYMRRFFLYPISLSVQTLANFGLTKTIKVGFSYIKASMFPIKPEKTLEQFLTNRFGKELYATFFKSYTEKVWGTACDEISAAWGAQRVKGLSLWKTLYHFVSKPFRSKDVSQKDTETSLIEQFLYPKFGPGQMWEYVAAQVKEMGGEIHHETAVKEVHIEGNRVVAIDVINERTNEVSTLKGDYFFSTMPMRDLVRCMKVDVPPAIKEISEGLVYRDFITVGLLLKEMVIKETEGSGNTLITDNWIYIQEPDVKLGRLQIFNNWSPFMVADQSKVWLGLEYFCNDTDDMWSWDDATMSKFAGEELERIGMIRAADIEDSTVIHMPKTYPGYFGTYNRFDELRGWIDQFENLFLVGRNGMHKYNNQDHSMLTAMVAVENIANGVTSKDNLWAVNTEEEYHEEKK